MNTTTGKASRESKVWHHRGPVVISPLFDWPPRPLAAFLSVTRRWVTATRAALFLVMAIIVYNVFMPDDAVVAALSPAWVVSVFLRNLVFLTLLAGSLHWYLFVIKGQQKNLKYDPREDMGKGKKFLFNDQLKDNIFWSLVWGVPIWSAYEVAYFWGIANGYLPDYNFSDPMLSFVIWLLVLPALLSTHFYFIHLFLHWPPVFHRFHRQHHNNIHIGPWSGLSMHPVEQMLYMSSVLIHFVVPTHPVIVLLHLYIRCMAPAFSHSGFEKLLVKDHAITDAADFHHQLHHKYFECNYGNVDAPWDRWLNTLHDGSDEATVFINERRKKMYAKRREQ